MSALTDLFTSLANKIRSKLGTSITYTPAEAISAIDNVYTKGVTDTKVGTATAGQVLTGYTFTNSSNVGISGTMANNGAVSQSLNCGGSYTVPAGYHNGSGKVTANSLASQTGVDSGKYALSAGSVLTGYQGWVNGSKITGTMANQGKKTSSLNCGGSYTIPAGYHDGTGVITANSLASQTGVDSGKTAVTAGAMISGYQGWVNGSKITGTFTAQTKSAASSTSAQTITPDSGKYLSSVSISAITPQRATGTAATTSGIDATGPYVYFPYGWWPNANTTYGNYTRMTAAQAVAACPKQEKTITSSRSAQTVSPDSGKLLSKVTVNALLPSGTYNASTTRNASIDMGATSNYRYVNTSSVANSNSGTYTFSSSEGDTVDLGATNTYRYVNALKVYDKGWGDGKEYAADTLNIVSNKTYYSGSSPVSTAAITYTCPAKGSYLVTGVFLDTKATSISGLKASAGVVKDKYYILGDSSGGARVIHVMINGCTKNSTISVTAQSTRSALNICRIDY